MGSWTNIQWTDATWNPVRGCSRVSPGCDHCYAERIATRFSGLGKPYEGFAKWVHGAPHWTGKVELIESALFLPLGWKHPRRVFVNSMSDLFHEALPDAAIDRVFDVMALTPQHRFQVLTKRVARMGTYLNDAGVRHLGLPWPWPMPNVWFGVSVENRAALSRLDDLRACRAAVRFVSFEPLLESLGRVDLTGIHWVIAGGESGPGARPMQLDWARSVRDQCRAAGVPVYMKQLGAKPFGMTDRISYSGNKEWMPDGYYRFLNDRKGGDPEEWPEDLRIREFPDNGEPL